MRHEKWSVWILASILVLGNLGLSSDAFAANDHVERITIGYTGSIIPETVWAVDDHDVILEATIFSGFPTDALEISKSAFAKNKFDSKIFLVTDVAETSTEIHTSWLTWPRAGVRASRWKFRSV